MSKLVYDVEGFIADFYMRQASSRKKRKKARRIDGDPSAYVVAKALVIAIKVLEQERPYRQSHELTAMRRVLRALCESRGFKAGLFEREKAFIDAKVAVAIQEASARGWAATMDRLVKDCHLTGLDESPFEG